MVLISESVADQPISAARLGRVLTLLPSTETTGGAQTSGAVVWQLLGQHASNTMFCYCGKHWRRVPPAPRLSAGAEVHARSKTSAVLTALRRTWRADIILVWHLGMLKLVPLFRQRRARLVVSLHGIEAWRPLDLLTRRLLEQADLVLTFSDHTWRRFGAANPTLKGLPHRTVHLGWAEPAGGDGPLAAPTRPRAVMVSRLDSNERYKGHAEVISAWQRVRGRVPDAELWIVGDGDLRPELEQAVSRLGLTTCVRFWGFVDEDRKRELIRSSRCLVLPSRNEGFGLVYLEAMRLGRPCLVSTLDAGREVVAPPVAGLAADIDSPDTLVDSICRLLTDGPEWCAWSRAATQRYAANFTARHFQSRLVDELANLKEAGLSRA
jgi:phosphatidylinositol alpha-1,6-mannosyltransferase